MHVSTNAPADPARIADLFERTFTASEGPDEGALIGALSRALIDTTPAADLLVCTTQESDSPVAAILLTRLHAPNDPRRLFMIAPVAVAPDHQGMGVGQSLLHNGLEDLKRLGADIAVTYGDPAYYGKVGFQPVTTEIIPAPQPLQMPQGWLAQTLTEAPLTPVNGPTRCVPAFDDPAYW